MLSGLNVVAFAADDDLSDTVDIYGSYYQGTGFAEGDHLYGDKARIDDSLKYNYKNEGVQWTAPIFSDVVVASAWNSATGEHLFYLSNPENEAFIASSPVWQKDEAVIYGADPLDSRAIEVYRMFNPNATKADTHVYKTENQQEDINTLISWGYVFEVDGAQTKEQVPYFYGLQKGEYEDVVELVDMEGLQSDGTALTTDTLQVIFGSELGVPTSVAWYKDGAVVKVITSSLSESSFKLGKNSNGQGTATPLTAGLYYAVVTNSDGKTFTTNFITVSDESAAEITDVSINDNLGVLENIAADKTQAKLGTEGALMPRVDQEAGNIVVNAKVNKDYDGKAYLVEAKDDYTVVATDEINLDVFDADLNPTGNTLVVTKKNFTDAYLSDAFGGYNGVTGAQIKALALQNTDGSVQYKFLAGLRTTGQLKRGTDYKIVYDQDNNAVGKKVKDLNASDAATCPYLYAPTSVEITNVQPSTLKEGWTLTLKTGDITSAWINEMPVNNTETVLYSIDEDGDETKFAQSPTIIQAGVAKDTANGGCVGNANDPYVYGVFTAEKGIFGPEAVELESDIVSTPDLIAQSATLTQLATDPSSFKLDVSKLRGSATAFLIGGDNNEATTGASLQAYAQALQDDGEYVAVARLEKGSSVSYTFEDAVDKFDNEVDPETDGDVYMVVIVPDDDEEFTMITSNGLNPIQQVSAIRFVKNTAQMSFSGATISVADAVRGMDQFLEDMDYTVGGATTITGVLASGTAQFKQTSAASTAIPDAAFKITVTAGANDDGNLSLTATDSPCAVGDTYEFKLSPLQTLVLTCVDAGGSTVRTAKWTLTIK